MNRRWVTIGFYCLLASFVFKAGPSTVRANEVFITIGGGDVSGVYYPAGRIIAKMLNNKRQELGIRATVEATEGSTFNLNAIIAGYLEFGLAQSDQLYQAVQGIAGWADDGPHKDLRAVFSIHHEAVTLVAAVDADINKIDDLKGKQVSIGYPGSNQHQIVMNALKASGLDPGKDFKTIRVTASEAPSLLHDYRIDAYFFTVGHPSESILKALSGERKARLVPIAGPIIDKLVADTPFYIHTTIPVGRIYPGREGQPEVDTFGIIATLCTSARMSEQVVYSLTREVFENFETFRRQHPAFYRLTRQGMLQGLSAPLHRGARKYFREVGLTD